MPVTAVFGMQWGDEGKGRIVDLLASDSDIVVRFQGGANAGHTVIVGEEKYVLHLLPSGVVQDGTLNVIGNGVVVDPWTLVREIDGLEARGIDLSGRLLLSDRAHVVLPHHKRMDEALEALRGDRPLGTTSRGIGPTYADKVRRAGMRVADILHPADVAATLEANILAWNAILDRAGMPAIDPAEAVEEVGEVAERLRPYVADTADVLLEAWQSGRNILLEGAQGFALDVDHGSYPYVTSSSTTPAGVFAGTGMPPKSLDRVVGVVKAYSTRVGAGPFPTRDTGPAGQHLGKLGNEFGATTGRRRDCGWFDGVVARRAARTSGVDGVALTKLDVLSGLDEIRVCVAYELDGHRVVAPPAYAPDWERCTPVYEVHAGWSKDISGVRRFEDLPVAAQRYVRSLEALMDAPVEMISVGPQRDRFIAMGGRLVGVS
ncbi:MAG: adenylosuccinate synthase [Planctomycetota bacterium]